MPHNVGLGKRQEWGAPYVEISESKLADTVIVAPKGRLDQDSAPDVQQRLVDIIEANPGGKVALDFAEVSYISSVGLRALMVAAKTSKTKGGAIAVGALTPVVREIFEISRFNYVVPVFDSLREALASLSADAATAFDDQ